MKALFFILFFLSGSLSAGIVKPSEESMEQDLKYSHDSQTLEKDENIEESEKSDRDVASEKEEVDQDNKIKFWSY